MLDRLRPHQQALNVHSSQTLQSESPPRHSCNRTQPVGFFSFDVHKSAACILQLACSKEQARALLAVSSDRDVRMHAQSGPRTENDFDFEYCMTTVLSHLLQDPCSTHTSHAPNLSGRSPSCRQTVARSRKARNQAKVSFQFGPTAVSTCIWRQSCCCPQGRGVGVQLVSRHLMQCGTPRCAQTCTL